MKKMLLGLALLMAITAAAQHQGVETSSMKVTFAQAFRDFDQQFEKKFKLNFSMIDQPDTTLNSAERTYLLNLLAETETLYNQAVENISSSQLMYKSDSTRWSIFEIMEHIAVVETGIFSIVQAELSKPADPSRQNEIKVKDENIVKILTNRRGKAQAPEQVRPTGRFPNAPYAKEAFHRQHEKISDFVKSATANLRNRYWKHMAVGVIDLYQTLILIAAHTQRHLLQIEETKQAEGFPK